MGTCSCSAEADAPHFGESERDMEVNTTKNFLQTSARNIKKSSMGELSTQKKKKKKKKKAQICGVGQEIYPTVSDHPTPAGACIWTNSYPMAIEHLSEEELKQISLDFREACGIKNNSDTTENVAKPSENQSIDVDQFTRWFSHYFGRVGCAMSNQLFAHLTASVDIQTRGFNDKAPELCYRPLVSAIYAWQKGTMRDKLILLFDMWDTAPKDGHLSKRELKKMVRAVSQGRAASTVMMMEALHLDISPFEQKDIESDPTTDCRKNPENKLKAEAKKFSSKESCAKKRAEIMKKIAASRLSTLLEEPGAMRKESPVGQDSKRFGEKESDPLSNEDYKVPYTEKIGKAKESMGLDEAQKQNVHSMAESKMKGDLDRENDEVDFAYFKNYEEEHARYESQACGCIDDELDLFINEVFDDMDIKHDGLVSVDEWLKYASGDRNIDDFLEHFTLQVM
mmetsp:Transcript_6426/g.8844  ORF Transcript_6426/g.8844 Transcript_6426/m.8844 type:complete len:453 (+) Transcript_6426:109-1467(+)